MCGAKWPGQLTEWVVSAGRPEHEPLRWALADSRQFVVTAVDDHLWLQRRGTLGG